MSSNRSRSNSTVNNRSYSPNVSRHTPNRRRRGSIHQQAGQSTNGGSAGYSPSVTPARSVKNFAQSAATPESSPSLNDGGISPTSRYYKNLQVLRRKDAHITSIFDQFAHVTLYYLDEEAGGKYERAGYEGVMFFFERDVEPKYGFFILNRQGMDDYVRHLHPTDIIEPSGEIVWIGTPHGRTVMEDEDKTAGLWSMSLDVRESLGDMMKRLHEYIKNGLPYPDEYRYGPDRIAPQQTHIEGPLPQSNGTRDVLPGVVNGNHVKAKTEEQRAKRDPIPLSQPNQPAMTEIDQLFAKLAVPVPTPPPIPSQSLTGLALLDTMFASVSNASLTASVPAHAPQALPAQLNQSAIRDQHGLAPPLTAHFPTEIISPQPSAAGLPQILTADVIHGLMGLGSDSRSTSRLSAYTSEQVPRSPSSAGARRSRERGYYADRGEDDGSASESSTGLDDGDYERTEQHSYSRTTITQPLLGVASAPSSGMLKGDATPRARPEILGRSSPSPLPESGSRKRPPAAGHTVSEANTLGKGIAGGLGWKDKSDAQVQSLAGRTVSAPSAVRVPFQAGEELWPDAASASTSGSINGADSVSGDEVVELDFSEIRALNDIRTLETMNASRGRKTEASGKQKDRQQREKKPETSSAGTPGKPSRSGKKEKQQRNTRNGTSATPSRNGSISDISVVSIISGPSPPPPVKEAKQGRSLMPADILRDVSADSVRGALTESGLLRKEGVPLDRNAFIREVLTLIHTDKTFADRLYQQYLGMIPGSS